MENLIISSKNKKRAKAIDIFFQKWAFQPLKAIDLIGFVGILKLFSGEL
jgi:hypothetical protein